MLRDEISEGMAVLLGWFLTFFLFYVTNEWGMWGWVCWFGIVGSPVITLVFLVRWYSKYRPYTILNYQPICAKCVEEAFKWQCRCDDPQGTIDFYADRGRDIVADMRMFIKNLPPGIQ